MTYVDRWMWDLTMYMVEAIALRQTDPHGVGERGIRWATRLRMAVEGAAKANISQGLAEIGGLAL